MDPSFIEKDWYAVKTLEIVSQIKDEKFSPAFSGGTSLSKGYHIIERFSEDLDFKINASGAVTRDDLRGYREKVFQTIRDNGGKLKIIDGSKKSGDTSRFFGCMVQYPKTFKTPQSLRPDLQLEFSFRPSLLAPVPREIKSFETEFRKGDPDLKINCIDPVETAADKLSALIWRVKDRKRGGDKDDPTLIRHLHDLAKLEKVIVDHKGQFCGITTLVPVYLCRAPHQ